MPRSSSASRRKIRARASGVGLQETALFAPPPTRPAQTVFSLAIPIWLATFEVRSTHPKKRLFRSDSPVKAREWGSAWAKARRQAGLDARWEVVQTSESLYSAASKVEDQYGEVHPVNRGQPTASTDKEIQAAITRVKEILGTLATRGPYGQISDYGCSLEWTEWIADGKQDPYPGKTLWWGTTAKPGPLEALNELESNLYEVLERGTEAASLLNYRHPGTDAVSWIEVTRLDAKWACGKCAPEPRIETPETIALLGKKPTATKAKRKATKAKRRATKAKARRTKPPKAKKAKAGKKRRRKARKGR